MTIIPFEWERISALVCTAKKKTVVSATAAVAACHNFVLFIPSSFTRLTAGGVPSGGRSGNINSEWSKSVRQRRARTVDGKYRYPSVVHFGGPKGPVKAN